MMEVAQIVKCVTHPDDWDQCLRFWLVFWWASEQNERLDDHITYPLGAIKLQP